MAHSDHGTSREQQVREIASTLGVADFVFWAPPATKGQALREAAGDGLLIVGEQGAILQVKSRDPKIAQADTIERTQSWLSKHIKRAADQGIGTKRELMRRHAQGKALDVIPTRALDMPKERRSRYINSIKYDLGEWPILVIVDHPKSIGFHFELPENVILFSFTDWLELHRRLRSTSAMLKYADRVLRAGLHTALGREIERYYALQKSDEHWAESSGRATSLPFLPHPTNFDELGADIYRDVMDKVWHDDGDIPWSTAAEYRRIVEFMDNVPPTIQAGIGRWYLSKRKSLQQGESTPSGLAKTNSDDRIVFLCSQESKWPGKNEWIAEVSGVTMLRHSQAVTSGASSSTQSLGIGALVSTKPTQGVAYAFVMLSGKQAEIAMPAELLRQFQLRNGIHDHSKATTVRASFAADDPSRAV